MVVPVGCCDEEGPGLPEKGVPYGGGIGEGVVPTVDPVFVGGRNHWWWL